MNTLLPRIKQLKRRWPLMPLLIVWFQALLTLPMMTFGTRERGAFVANVDFAILVLILARILRAKYRKEESYEWLLWFAVLLLAIPIRIVFAPMLHAWI